MTDNIEATADLIMSARHSDAFDREACVKILRDNLSGGVESRHAPGATEAKASSRESEGRNCKSSGKPESRGCDNESTVGVSPDAGRGSGSSAPPAQSSGLSLGITGIGHDIQQHFTSLAAIEEAIDILATQDNAGKGCTLQEVSGRNQQVIDQLRNVDLSALREHDEKLTVEVRQPLMDALKKYMKAIDAIYNHNEAARVAVIVHFGIHHDRLALDALAKVKETK